jgi:hypothetical protein
LTIKRKEILSFVGKRIELENIMLSEIRQVQRDKVTCFVSCGKHIQIQMQALSHRHNSEHISKSGTVRGD